MDLFCIDLQMLNNRTVKDACSLPRIEDSLDCLDGAQIFTSLNLKAGFYECKNAFWADQCAHHLPEVDGVMFGPQTLHNLFG